MSWVFNPFTNKLDWAGSGSGGSGTVTSVALSTPSFLSVSGSPITTSGTLALSYSGTALPLANGGTGGTTAPDARTNLGLGSAAVLTAGAALGAATLDAGGTVPLAQLPSSLTGGVSYQGTWNATTNSPTLTSSVGTKGYYYVVSVAGSTNLNGITDWKIGDWAIFNGSVWEKVDNTEAVTSVNGLTGTVNISYAPKQVDVFTSADNATYTAPANTQWVKVTCVGSGGVCSVGLTGRRCTGGGGGGVAIKWLAMTAGQTLTYNLLGAAATVSSGTRTITTITGGAGGAAIATVYANSTTTGPAGGTASGGDININGGAGGNSYGSGTTIATNFSGAGGNCPGFGSGGGAVGSTASNGNGGTGYGGGAGGVHGTGNTTFGAQGVIIFEAY